MSRNAEPGGEELRARADRLAEHLVGRHPEIIRLPGARGERAIFAESRVPVGAVICSIWQGEDDAAVTDAHPGLRPELLIWLRSVLAYVAACVQDLADAKDRPELTPGAADLGRAVRVLAADQTAGSPPEFAAAVADALATLRTIGATAQVEKAVAACEPVRPAHIEDWYPVEIGDGTHLVGRVTGHPTVVDGHRVLSTWVIGTSARRGLVLTFSGQLYQLGRPARAPALGGEPSDPSDAADAEREKTPRRLH
jgi:uncharacterized protein (DUF433 family)